jgi:hypothetical protein
LACALFAIPASALTLTTPGVVGAIYTGTQPSPASNELAWANYLLGLGANATVTVDAPGDSDPATEQYRTSATDYNATLSGGTQVPGNNAQPSTYNVSAYSWVLAKYDGKNAGYVLFYVPDTNGTISGYSNPLWGSKPGQYALSHYTYFTSATRTPDGGATLLLLGLALSGIGAGRRFMKI